MDHVGKAVPDTDGRDHVEPQQGEVGKVFVVEGFAVKVRVDEAESPECASAEGVLVEVRYKDALRVAGDDMGDGPRPVDEDADLLSDLCREPGKIAPQLLGDQEVKRHPPSIDPLEVVEDAFFQPCGMPVYGWYRSKPLLSFY